MPALLIAGLLMTGTVAAESPLGTDFDEYYQHEGEPPKEWQEQGEVTLPPHPENADLIEVAVSGATQRYFIDARSIRLDDDGIVRLTVVTEMAGGARTVTYEGHRCKKTTYKRYAAAVNASPFTRLENPDWIRITPGYGDRFRQDLQNLYLCNTFKSPRAVAEIIRRLRQDN